MKQPSLISKTLIRACVILLCIDSMSGAREGGDYIHFRLGVKYKNENRIDQAIDEFRRVLAAYPDNYNAYMHLAEIRLKQKQGRLAIYNLKKALSYNPGWGKAHKLLARSYEMDRQFEKAIMELQLYQQSCDPAERDSVQNEIRLLVQKSQGIEPSVNKQTETADAKETNVTAAASATIPRTSTPKKPSGAIIKPVPSRTPQIETFFQQAVREYDNREFDKSIATVKKVLGLQPGHPGAYYYAGLIRRRQGKNSMAKINFQKALAYPDLGYNAFFYLGKIYGEEKQYPAAIENLEKYIQRTSLESGEREARRLIAQYRAAHAASQKKPEPKKPVVLPLDLEMERGVVTKKYAPFEVRIDSLLTMVVLDTLTDAGQGLLGGVRAFQKNNYDDAVREFKKVLLDHPSGAVAAHSIYNTGVCYFKMRLFKDAENQFQQILNRYSTHALAPKSLFLKALSYLERKDGRRAETLFREYIRNNRNGEWLGKAYEKLGDAYHDLEMPKKAVDAYGQAVTHARTVNDKVHAWFKQGESYLEVQNTRRALAAFESVIKHGEKNNVYVRVPDAYFRIADYHYKQRDYKTALSYYKKVVRRYVSYQEVPWGLFQIGNIYKNTRNFRQAIDTYDTLMKKFPDDYWAKQARWKKEDAVWENEYQAVLK